MQRRRALPLPCLALSLALGLIAVACDKPTPEAGSARPATPAPTPVAAPSPTPAPTPAPANGPAPSDMPQKTADAATPAPATPAPATLTPATPTPAARPLYFEGPLPPDALEGRTLRELTLMRNYIYARAGQSFRKPWLDSFFRKFDWYAPTEQPDLKKLSPADFTNAEAIVNYETSLSRETLQARQKEILARKQAGSATPEDDIELELLAVALGGWTGEAELKPVDLSPLADPTKLDALLAANQLATLSLRDLRMLRNTIYARRGRPFRSSLLQSYFGEMEWYQIDDGYSDAKLTPIDRKNIRLIQSVEKANGGPLSDYEHKVEEGWFFAA